MNAVILTHNRNTRTYSQAMQT